MATRQKENYERISMDKEMEKRLKAVAAFQRGTTKRRCFKCGKRDGGATAGF